MKSLISRVPSILTFFSLSKEIRVAKRVIRSLQLRSVKKSKKYILIEAFQTPSNRLALTIFAPTASKFYDAKLVAFYMMPITPLKYVKERIRFLFSVEKSFGCSRFVYFGSKTSREYEQKARDLLDSVSNLRELEELKYREVVIGDLVYDVYLRKFRRPTVDLTDFGLVEVISQFLQHFDQLYKRFLNEEVAGVCVSHTVYLLGLPSRIAAFFAVPAFQVTGEKIDFICQEKSHAYTSFKYYPEMFRRLSDSARAKGKQLAYERLNRRISGEIGVDMFYSRASAYSPNQSSKRLLDVSSRPKILIAIHDFFDSPHSYGNNLYPDFYEWLLALAKVAKLTDYSWYIKTHPDIRGDGDLILDSFVSKFPQFQILPASTSHHQLIREGISVALTIFGTIGVEYPFLGIPVIAASQNQPHFRYNFCLSPKNVIEYESTLLHIDQLKPPKEMDSILEYYFMHNIFMLKSWLIPDYEKYFRDIGGSDFAYGWKIFEYFSEKSNSFPVQTLQKVVFEFLNTRSLFISREHFVPFIPTMIEFDISP
jgi:hypothetical protein